jgi:hypothetical protein
MPAAPRRRFLLFLDVAASRAFYTLVARLGAGQALISGHWLQDSVLTTRSLRFASARKSL